MRLGIRSAHRMPKRAAPPASTRCRHCRRSGRNCCRLIDIDPQNIMISRSKLGDELMLEPLPGSRYAPEGACWRDSRGRFVSPDLSARRPFAHRNAVVRMGRAPARTIKSMTHS